MTIQRPGPGMAEWGDSMNEGMWGAGGVTGKIEGKAYGMISGFLA